MQARQYLPYLCSNAGTNITASLLTGHNVWSTNILEFTTKQVTPRLSSARPSVSVSLALLQVPKYQTSKHLLAETQLSQHAQSLCILGIRVVNVEHKLLIV